MRNRAPVLRGVLVVAAAILLHSSFARAQVNGAAPRINAAIDENNRVTLRGNTHPWARAENDRGAAPGSLPMQRMLLVLKRGADQESVLETLLEQQQDASSPNFHKWLTPQQFGLQFGPSDQDVQTVTAWLQSRGFQVARVSNGRTVIEFSGTADQVQQAFHTAIHQYQVGGKQYMANSSDPEIPSALTPVVAGINTLHNFPRQPMHYLSGEISRSPKTGKFESTQPSLTTFGGNCGVPGLQCYGLSPYDFATIYNVTPLWAGAPAIDGTGVTIAVVGESDVNVQDVRNFRNIFGLAAKDPQVIVDGPDPGTVPGDETESDLDLEWSGGVAKGATIDFVISQTTEASLGVDLSAQYIVDNNLAPILSESYGICELFLGTTGNQFYNQLWQQAAAQGITVLVSTGDSGSAVCDRNAGTNGPAQFGLSVNGFSSTPYNIAVGGTDFNDLTNVSTYWNPTNTVPPGAPPGTPATFSVKSYIPETTWNDTCTNAVFGNLLGFSANAETNCNNPQLQNAGFDIADGSGSGGKSNCINGDGQNPSSCTQGYAKPSWQTALTPHDSARDVPDVSMMAAAGSPSGAFYLICAADITSGGSTSCQASDPNTHYIGIGGTSASTPVFAGIMALVNQATGSRQGNAANVLYKLAGQSGNSCNSSSGAGTNCVFYDTTDGTIAMPCAKGSANCTVSNQADSVGVLSGYATTSGYDLATGLGSVNANNLVTKWKNFSLTPSTTTLALNGGAAINITHGQSVNVNIGVTGSGGTPSGNVALIANTGTNGTEGVQGFTLNAGSAAGATKVLPGGSYTVFAQYAGDGTFASSPSPTTAVTVNPEASQSAILFELFDLATGRQTNGNATTATYGSLELLRMNVTSTAGDTCAQATPSPMGCPTGNLTITNNGAPLDGGTFALNSQGYAEDQAVQLPAGANNLVLAYPGDNSFGASNGSTVITITPATTSTAAIFNPVPQALVIGAPAGINGMTTSQSLGIAPTGNFSVRDGNTVVGTSGVLGFAGSFSRGANCQALVDFSVGPPSGQHMITVQYSGDTNYGSSTSAAVKVNVVYPVTVSVAADSNNVVYGNSVTITADVDTGNPASNASLKPTGTVSLSSANGSITPVTTTVTQDVGGNWMLHATATTTPQQSEYISANYSGDANYEPLGNNNPLFVTVIVPDFNVSPNPGSLTITAGQTGTTTLTVSPTTNYASTVALSCGGIGYVIPGATCSFSPSSVALTNGASATASFSLSTPAPSSGTTAQVTPDQERFSPPMPKNGGPWWTVGACYGVIALLLLAASFPRRRSRYACLRLALLCGLTLVESCGGGSGGGGGGGGTSGPAATKTTLSTPTTKVAPGALPTLTATVSSSKPVSGTVTFSSQSCGFTSFVSLVNGTAQVQLAPAVAICDVTAKYGGDPNNLPSQSGILNIVFTGTTTEAIVAKTGPDTHTIMVNVTLQ